MEARCEGSYIGRWRQDCCCRGSPARKAVPIRLPQRSRLTAESLDLDSLHGFYQAPALCVWTDETAALLQATLAKLGDDGLDPEQYHATALTNRANPVNSDAAQERDLLATDAALAYARTMASGRVDVASLSDQIDFPHPLFDPVEPLRLALGHGDLTTWLAQLPPPDPQYAALKGALAHYRTLAAWQPVPPPGGKAIDPGMQDPVIPALKQRLVIEGELAAVDAGG